MFLYSTADTFYLYLKANTWIIWFYTKNEIEQFAVFRHFENRANMMLNNFRTRVKLSKVSQSTEIS